MEFMQGPLWLAGLAAAMAATGLVSGTLAGRLGVGGGVVIVPVLFNVLPLFGIPEAVQMKLEVGTSPATIMPTSIQSARKHFAKGTMNVALLRSLAPSIATGVLLGTALAIWLRGDALTLVFALVASAVVVNMATTGAGWRLRESFPTGGTLPCRFRAARAASPPAGAAPPASPPPSAPPSAAAPGTTPRRPAAIARFPAGRRPARRASASPARRAGMRR